MKNKLKKILEILIVLISVIIIVASIYYKSKFIEQSFEAILYNLLKDGEKANYGVILVGIKECALKLLVFFTIFYIPIIIREKNKYVLNIHIKNKTIKIPRFNKKIYLILLFIFSILFACKSLGIFQYIDEQTHTSTLFEDKYIDTANTKITMPEEKRNLIFIFIESMENSVLLEEDGGEWEYPLTPELEEIAKDNINFSNNDKIGGAIPVGGTSWTIAGMVAQTCGIPLKLAVDGNEYSGYSSFLPGAYSLGDLLEEEGYNQEVMFGSDASFGARDTYFSTHGDYEIFDYNTAIEIGKMTAEDKVWWGFSDDDLFEWSKEEILDLANEDNPFCYILLTADTHFIDGYLSEKAEKNYDSKYENVYAYSSKCINEFVEWIKAQDFYDNTTIVLVGDHLGMQAEFYKEHIDHTGYVRTIYNVFINSAIPAENTKNRQFSAFDIFPTVLASMGAKIDGERLGLGTNLFSGKETLIEEKGYNELNAELAKKSNFYNKKLLQDDYISMLNTKLESQE